MRVDGDGRDAEGVAQHDVGGLAPHPGQGDELVAGGGHDAVAGVDEGDAQVDEAPRPGALHPQGPQLLLQGLRIGPGQGGGVGVAGEERRGEGVDAPVGGLGGQDGGDQQLEGAVVDQGAAGAGVEAGELVVDRRGAPGGALPRGRRRGRERSGRAPCHTCPPPRGPDPLRRRLGSHANITIR